MAFIGPLEDRICIRELQDSFADAINRKAKDEWLAFWADDGVWIAGALTATGKAEIADQWEKFYSPYNPSRNNETRFYRNTPAAIIINDFSASARSYIEVLIIYSGTLTQKLYYYVCEEIFVKRDNKWIISRRQTSRFHPREI